MADLDMQQIILQARAEGRAEAVEIITNMCADDALGDLTGWSHSGAPEDEGSAYWDLDKLRATFHVDDTLYNAFAAAECMYYECYEAAMVLQYEAEQRRAAPTLPKVEAGPDDTVDAARWRAMLGSARIRILGSAGINQSATPDGTPYNNYAHFGMEIWTKYGRDYTPELLANLDRGNEQGREVLTKYADIAIAARLQARQDGEDV